MILVNHVISHASCAPRKRGKKHPLVISEVKGEERERERTVSENGEEK